MKLSFLSWLLLSSLSFAGSAAFLPGGKQVARADEERIMVLNLEDRTEAPLVLPEVLTGIPPLAVLGDSSERGSNMALSPDGKRAMVYVASARKWFDVDPETGKWKAAGAAEKKKAH